MDIRYLSAAEAAQFGSMIHDDSELAELFGSFMLQMDVDTDFDSVMISFEDETVLRAGIEDSPYVVVFDEPAQTIRLEQGKSTEEFDFDEDGVETVVDVMASRILTKEYDDEYR
jgi:hypothetical protein